MAVVLITGGSSGIGLASARRFLENQDQVYITGRSKIRLKEVADTLNHPALHWLQMDVSIPSECQKVIEQVLKEAGSLDVLVNSAGVCYTGPTETMTEEIFDTTMNTNVKGTYFMCQYSIPALSQSKGSIVNVSSDAGLIGNAGLAIYCASKGGVTLLTKSLAVELAKKQIRVNAVCPGEVDTPMVDLEFENSAYATRDAFDEAYLGRYPQGEHARYTRAEEVAECIFFLAQKDRIGAVTGACLSVDFGITAGY